MYIAYYGLFHSQLNTFLKAADDLKVKELCNPDQENFYLMKI